MTTTLLILGLLGLVVASHLGWWLWVKRLVRVADATLTHADLQAVAAERRAAAATLARQQLHEEYELMQQVWEKQRTERIRDEAERQALATQLLEQARQDRAEADAREARILALQTDQIRDELRWAFAEVGLNVDAFADDFDLSTTGKLNEVLHFVSLRHQRRHPLKTVWDVVHFLQTAAQELGS